MRNITKKGFTFWAVALSLVLVGCESTQETALTAPGEVNEVVIRHTTADGVTLVRETDPTVGVVSAVIDQKGGVLSIGKHLLWVPEGSVAAPTTFVMHKLPGQIKVDLTATRVLPNDVGAAGFRKPVRLMLSYDDVPNIDPARLRIGWANEAGHLVIQPSYVDTANKRVIAALNHFSAYILFVDE